MSQYVNNLGHPHKIDGIIKSGLADTGSSGTCTRPEDPHEISHKLGQAIFVLSECENILPSNTECTLALPHLP